MVGVQPEPRLAPGDPQRLVRPEPQAGPAASAYASSSVAGDDVVAGVRRAVAAEPPGRQATASSSVTSATSTRIMNRIRSRNATSAAACAGLDVGGERLAVVDAVEGVLDVALRAEDQRPVGYAGREALEVLGGQRVQPGQPVRPGDAEDAAVREVDEAVAGDEGPLLTVEGAVVGGHRSVDAVGGDRAGQGSSGLR